ncbi:MAG: hypothetical protein GWP61_22805 [Chloroflexi bacterium]|nr:hypothetical protein [Chloroflexota bacterium]
MKIASSYPSYIFPVHMSSVRDDEVAQISNLFPKKVYPMRPNSNLKRGTISANYVYKTADGFIPSWKEQDELRQQVVTQRSTQSAREMALALMAWEDDGGPPA